MILSLIASLLRTAEQYKAKKVDDDDDDDSHSGYARRPYEPSLVAAYHYNKQRLSTHDPKDQPTPHSTLMSEERDSLPVW